MGDKVFDVEHTLDVVECLAIDGDARVTRGDDNLFHSAELLFDVQCCDIQTGVHDVVNLAVGKLHDTGEHLSLFLIGLLGHLECIGELVN